MMKHQNSKRWRSVSSCFALLFAIAPFISLAESMPIVLHGAHDITISDKSISESNVPDIELINCYNIHITKNYLGKSRAMGIRLYKCQNITIDYNYITNVSTGVYAENCNGGILVNNNQFKNMTGPFPRGQFVQFNNVGGAGNSVSRNIGENIMGASNPEDAISMYKSNGTAASPIIISGNWIRGGGPSKTGGGIMLGDNGGSYQIAQNNILVNPGQYGIAIAGGHNLQILNNKVYSSQTSISNVGIYVWNQSHGVCSTNTVRGNQVNWTNAAGAANDSWNKGNCGMVAGWNNNIWRAHINSAMLPDVMIYINKQF